MLFYACSDAFQKEVLKGKQPSLSNFWLKAAENNDAEACKFLHQSETYEFNQDIFDSVSLTGVQTGSVCFLNAIIRILEEDAPASYMLKFFDMCCSEAVKLNRLTVVKLLIEKAKENTMFERNIFVHFRDKVSRVDELSPFTVDKWFIHYLMHWLFYKVRQTGESCRATLSPFESIPVDVWKLVDSHFTLGEFEPLVDVSKRFRKALHGFVNIYTRLFYSIRIFYDVTDPDHVVPDFESHDWIQDRISVMLSLIHI